jgi:CxxC motif-containing protein (DUF1111 family)
MRLVFVFMIASSGAACGGGDGAEPGEELSGGSSTVFDQSRDAFSFASPALKDERRDGFFVGNATFNRNWVTAPASAVGVDGLGPTFNATSCSACHLKDGRGHPPLAGEPTLSLLARLSIPGTGAHGGPVPEPTYGGQLQNAAILGVPTEGTVRIDYDELVGSYGDGTAYSLRRPRVAFDSLAFGPMAADVMISARVAPANFGLGLLEAIPEADILARADPDDADGDGISGRPNQVWDQTRGSVALGRFGWKANQPSIRQQVAGAFQGDIGITSPVFPDENCPAPQTDCAAAPSGGAPEIDEPKLVDVVFYGQTLAVPGRRDVGDATVLLGKALFAELRCASCHVPRFVTGPHEVPELVGQTIYPYTDLLLHDLGDGLADGRPDYLATGREWRTAPLWGIGLVPIVNQHSLYLHDGRARGLAEAILWHGGEAEASKEAFRNLPADDRAALLRFLESL